MEPAPGRESGGLPDGGRSTPNLVSVLGLAWPKIFAAQGFACCLVTIENPIKVASSFPSVPPALLFCSCSYFNLNEVAA